MWQESRGKVSLVVASLSYNGVPLNAGKNNPGRPGTQVEMRCVPIIYETNLDESDKSGDLRGFQTFSMTSLRQFQGLLKRTGLKLSAA